MSDSIWQTDEFKPYHDQWLAREMEFSARASYYDGSVYRHVKHQLGWLGPRLYKNIKPLFLPLARAVDVDAGIVPGEWAFAADAPEAWGAARDQIWSWSSWMTHGVLYVHYGAIYGCSVLKVSDLRELKRVLIQAVNPKCVLLTDVSAYGNQTGQSILVETRYDVQGAYEYAEVITPETIRTFKNGAPFGYNERDAVYINELKFVPFVEVRHIETGEALGECTYQKATTLLDEVNELASYLADIIKKHAEPQWAIMGAEGSDLEKSGDNVWFLPGGASAQILVPGIDIAGVLEFVREIGNGVKESLPELAFDELKKGQIATATIELQLAELTLKIKRVRPNYDDGLVRALRMCGQAAQGMGLPQIAVLDDETLALDNKRPVLPLDPKTAMELEMQALQLEREKAYP